MNSTPWGGHSGVHGTQLRLRALFYWPTLLQDVKKNVADCETCQRNKGEIVAYPRLLQPLPISSRAWEHIAMDFIRLPKTYGKDSVLVVIDMYTKFAHFFALTHILPPKLHKYSRIISANYMDCLAQLSLIETPFLGAISGKNCLKV